MGGRWPCGRRPACWTHFGRQRGQRTSRSAPGWRIRRRLHPRVDGAHATSHGSVHVSASAPYPSLTGGDIPNSALHLGAWRATDQIRSSSSGTPEACVVVPIRAQLVNSSSRHHPEAMDELSRTRRQRAHWHGSSGGPGRAIANADRGGGTARRSAELDLLGGPRRHAAVLAHRSAHPLHASDARGVAPGTRGVEEAVREPRRGDRWPNAV